MSSMLRTRFGIPGVIATVALVFAMTSGAFAAKYLITSTNQIKPSVLKQLKGQKGPAGPQGLQGLPGANGSNGAKGDQGPIGPEGPQGEKGKDGTNGTNGKSPTITEFTGAEGSCTVGGSKFVLGATETYACNGETGFTETLPSGKTETGAWIASVNGEGFVSMPFNIPLAAALPGSNVHVAPEPTNCPGTAANPQAVGGHLCVYTTQFIGTGFVAGIQNVAAAGFGEAGAAKSGAGLVLSSSSASLGWGTWAVTAP